MECLEVREIKVSAVLSSPLWAKQNEKFQGVSAERETKAVI